VRPTCCNATDNVTRLPPLNPLRTFEAAAHHDSFTRAAEELHVTPAAVSRQVKLLEEYLGVELFERDATGGLGPVLDQHPGPLLLLWGAHDVTAEPAPAAQTLGGGRAQCRTVLVPEAGHWLQYESAERTNAELLAWLDPDDAR